MRLRIRAGLGLALILAAAFAACNKPPAPQPPPPSAVTVAHPITRDTTIWDEFTGKIEARPRVDVRARVSGYVMAAPFTEGTIVSEGTLLYQIDEEPFRAQLAVEEGNVSQAQARLELAQADLARAAKPLAQGALTQEEFETRKAEVHAAEGWLASAKANLRIAQDQLDWCQVKAPITGEVGMKLVLPGNLISGGAGSAPASQPAGGNGSSGGGTQLTNILAVDPIYCNFDVEEHALLNFERLGVGPKAIIGGLRPPCYLALEDEKDFPHEGKIEFTDNHINASTGTMVMRGVFNNADSKLTDGSFVRVRVKADQLHNAVMVADSAVATDQNLKYVLTVDDSNIARRRVVEIGPLTGNYRIITKGLSVDDRVIVNGMLKARPGVPVNPTETDMDSIANATLAQGPPASNPATATAPATAPAGGRQ